MFISFQISPRLPGEYFMFTLQWPDALQLRFGPFVVFLEGPRWVEGK